jgi:CMP-N-acetylneuraminic acid synthetase
LNILALIPARGGSKGIPRKNIKTFCGKPLIAWTIEPILKSNVCCRVVVSTEDHEIASIAKSFGADVPFIRPLELALDSTPGIDPVLHAISNLENYDWLLLLQPTSPLRTVEDIIGIIEFANNSGGSSFVSVNESNVHPFSTYKIGEDNLMKPLFKDKPYSCRQDLPKVYAPNGALYLVKTSSLLRYQAFINELTAGYIMPKSRSIDIDEELDWDIAEALMLKKMMTSKFI